MLGSGRNLTETQFCEDLLMEYFGATSVDSIDNSNYEKATIIHDMNAALPEHLHGKFDTVIDGGCLEHIYNIPQALKNCSQLVRRGGQIIHILPANNFCGHGFWQVSPELFFSLYSAKNGYSETEVFLADLADEERWFRVKRPENGLRVDVTNSTPVYVLARTVLDRSDFSHADVQQSDYRYEWENGPPPPPPRLKQRKFKQALLANPFTGFVLQPIYEARLRAKSTMNLNERNPGLQVVAVDSCV